MNERIMQFWVGVMVFATCLLVAILILLLGNKPAMFQRTYTVFIDFFDAPNVTVNTPIRKSGILIGRVKDVELLRDGGVRLTAGIHSDVQLPDNARCSIETSLLGDANIEFSIPPGVPASPDSIPAGSVLEGHRVADPVDAITNLQGDLALAIKSVADTSVGLGQTIGKINDLLDQNEAHINSIVKQTDDTLKLVQETVKFTNELMDNPNFRRDLKAEIEQLPKMLAEARTTIEGLQGTMKRMNVTIGKVDNNLDNVSKFTQSLGTDGPNILKGIDRSAQQLEKLMVEMQSFGQSINSDKGTIGKLVKDDEIYRRLNRTVRNIEEISYRLKPIVNDARVVSDRLARHPGSILRDAIRPGSGSKGLPPTDWDQNPNTCPQPASNWRR
jgi:phospholipid/cholesterol/gamma-HCH transport system substrate-binding protein